MAAVSPRSTAKPVVLSLDIDEAKCKLGHAVEELKEALLNLIHGDEHGNPGVFPFTALSSATPRSPARSLARRSPRSVITVGEVAPPEPISEVPVTVSSSRNPHLRLSTEFDTEDSVFVNKAKLRLLGGKLKLKASGEVDLQGHLSNPLLGVAAPFFTLDYDVHGGNTLVDVFADIKESARVSYRRDVQSQLGSLSLSVRSEAHDARGEVLFDTTEGRYVPTQLAKASLSLPLAELRYVSDSCDSEDKGLSAALQLPLQHNARAKAHLHYPSKEAALKFHFKDENVTFIPSIEWPSGAIRLVFKRKFSDAHKLSLSYDPVSYDYNTVYKFKPQEHFKIKAGADKAAGMAWGSIWFGSESDGCSSAPSKFKSQLMLQVPYEGGLEAAALLFRFKKRIDLL